MEENKKFIAVTWDFTVVSENALEHAIRISRTIDQDIHLLHVIKKGASVSEKEEKRKKLEVTCEETYKRFNIKPLIVFWKDPYLQILRNTLQIIKPV
ncbi:MAG: universal stress protein [Bacteroidales bacterium]|nr:universal stress protein [Bacteroidales bacterium]